MTNTLYQNIQALGNKMASNLETMGVSASFNDGGLTLAEKILQIQHFTNGLLLSADKSVDQSGNTVKLTALYMSNGETVSGKEVSFFGLKESTATSRTISSTDWVNVGCKYKITSANNNTSYLDKGEHIGIIYASGYFVLMIDGNLQTAYYGNDFEFEDGIVTYTDLSNNTQTIDFTDYDLSAIKGANGDASITIDDYGVFDTTDSNGVATASYTCTGAGEKTVQAISGSVVSQPYTVMDYINFDNGLDGDSSNIWTGATSSLTRTSTGSVFSSTSAQKLTTTALISGDFEATFEAYGTGSPLWGVQDSSSNMTRFYMRNDESFTYYKITRANGVFSAKYSVNGTTWTNLTPQSSDVTSADCYFLFHNNTGTKTTTFKNLKIYPI